MLEETFTVVPFDNLASRAKPAVPEPGALEALTEIAKEIRELRGAVEALTEAVRTRPAGAVTGGTVTSGGATVRVLTADHARREVQEFFLKNRGGTLYPDQIAQALGLGIAQVAEICEALAAEGRLERE